MAGPAALAAPPLELIELPPGFAISVYAEDVPNAREMALGTDGTLFVGSRSAGNVYAVTDEDGDGGADRTVVIDSGLTLPSGVAFRGGALYVGAVSRVLRYDGIEQRLDDPPEPVVVTDALPSDTHHGWKFIDFGPDGKLYVPVGAPCNVCLRRKPYAGILRMNPDGSGAEVYARGVRNSVGFAWHPETGELWFTDNGRDQLGDNTPPGELNRAPEAGLHFGFPHCHGRDVPDPRYASGTSCADFTPPAQELGPHVAPLGMTFYDGAVFPEAYRNQVFIAEHGSWNRSQKIGYRVTLVRLGEDGLPASYDVFARGWLQGQRAWGRPADVLVMPDGALLVSDDGFGAIYRITYAP
ncbi:MAG: sorbosone dehydrogenase family protein [Alphaproteobacteria bacterium]|nr:sorbosone dehydrogenase family protein [Alphaproteobacteria bacterium]MDP6517951.1 sorbosone dehydrogenase family protein [Alphaproteobacteria bacterium]